MTNVHSPGKILNVRLRRQSSKSWAVEEVNLKTFIIRRVTIYLFLIVFPILSSSSTSFGYKFWCSETEPKVCFSWPVSSIPVQYRISNSVPSAFRDDIERGFNTWSNVTGSYFRTYRGPDDNGNTSGNDGVNRISWITSGWDSKYPGFPGAIA